MECLARYGGRVAIVTGVSSGIGAALVRDLAARGIKVAGCARSEDKLQELKDSLGEHSSNFLPIRCDLLVEAEVDSFFERVVQELGSIDILINNAGIAFNSSILDGNLEDWRTMLMLNVLSFSYCTQKAVQAMQQCNVSDGYIININSESGHMHPVSTKFHFYSATKHAVRALQETLRLELKSVLPTARVSSVSPGLVKTQFLAKMKRDPEARLSVFDKMQALTTQDVVRTVVQLLDNPIHVQVNDVLLRPTEQKY